MTHILSHLPAASLASVSLVSRRFYGLVTTPHAWRVAFSRFFPGQDAVEEPLFRGNRHGPESDDRERLKLEQRFFTRLTGLASWRSEYIQRTRLLKALARGKPAQIVSSGHSSRMHAVSNNSSGIINYHSQLWAPINHIEGAWDNGKKTPRFIHASDEIALVRTSDPAVGKVDDWGMSDPQPHPQFADLFPGDSMYGLGPGQVIGTPNVMDVSSQFGAMLGSGFPGGRAYFTPLEEKRGRFLAVSEPISEHELGIPKIAGSDSICSVWIAKSSAIPDMTGSLVGILTGSSSGMVSAYSVGSDRIGEERFDKGELTAIWMLSPGVPIISICVDDSFSVKRKAGGRVWAVVLNALGEVFYLTGIPTRPLISKATRNEREQSRLAWATGRGLYWDFVEPSRRTARDDTYNDFEYDGSYTPRSSCSSMDLAAEQVIAETREIEKFTAYPPAHFQKICEGWDMRRQLQVDFGGDDGFGSGENIIVICRGIGDEEQARILRYSRVKFEQSSLEEYPTPKTPPMLPVVAPMASLFGGGIVKPPPKQALPKANQTTTPHERIVARRHLVEEWRTSLLALPNDAIEITTSAIDMSTFALQTAAEDPLLTIGGAKGVSGLATPTTPTQGPIKSPSDIPGQRARLLAVGTKVGSIVVWNLRGPQPANSTTVNELQHQRFITTDSPEITCLAVSSLFLVHGGSDGLVQTWDPLASTMQPVRTLNSRFSSVARRRLVQAAASVRGVGLNMFAAAALAIDPDPTVLRGIVSLGTHLRYWSYSSSGADELQSKKRRVRRSQERGNNATPDRFSTTGRGALMDYIANEQEELRSDKERRAREDARMRGRFGVDFAGLTEEEALIYASMVSQEEFQRDEQRRASNTSPINQSYLRQGEQSNQTATPQSSAGGTTTALDATGLDHDMEEAIRLSLLESNEVHGARSSVDDAGDHDLAFRIKPRKTKRSPEAIPSAPEDDLEYALQLSLAEEESRKLARDEDHFPELASNGIDEKGKGRALM